MFLIIRYWNIICERIVKLLTYNSIRNIIDLTNIYYYSIIIIYYTIIINLIAVELCLFEHGGLGCWDNRQIPIIKFH